VLITASLYINFIILLILHYLFDPYQVFIRVEYILYDWNIYIAFVFYTMYSLYAE